MMAWARERPPWLEEDGFKTSVTIWKVMTSSLSWRVTADLRTIGLMPLRDGLGRQVTVQFEHMVTGKSISSAKAEVKQ